MSVLFFSGVFVYCMKYKHFLIMLLSLEVVVLSIFISFLCFFSFFNLEVFTSIIYLAMSVCEGALGLSLLVLIIRTHGSDMILNFDLLW
uniref:NADH-ubiquinone oxidoreductase chain 4L n=1 Tax=Pityogenes bidentatus TaxID=1325381 RepID=A0A2D0VPF7_9CUCU|nr:NADH dehydrogenase subunit 4L [Pityogenes bidentatus]AOY40172.1 NADH dehydrogenase subunit 4L [Pityogenes bidentatus]